MAAEIKFDILTVVWELVRVLILKENHKPNSKPHIYFLWCSVNWPLKTKEVFLLGSDNRVIYS